MMSLMSLVLFLFAELIVLVFGLWLLFRTTFIATEPAQLKGEDGLAGAGNPQGLVEG
jgi:hypothetical protein